MTYGEYVRQVRERLRCDDRRYSLRQVAQRIGVEPAYLSKIERGDVPPPSEQTTRKLAGELGEDLDMLGMGFTLGYHINDNIQLTAGYMATINDSAPTDLRMDMFKLSLTFGWHPLIEGMKRLGGD